MALPIVVFQRSVLTVAKNYWFFKGFEGFRQPVGAVKAPTGLLIPRERSDPLRYPPTYLGRKVRLS